MPDTLTTNSPIITAYRAATPGSAERASRAQDMFPSGITHDSRYIEPYGLYITRAEGPRKWDVDGNCYVDYFGGHGAMLLGHCNPQVMAAVHAQPIAAPITAPPQAEIEWARLVKQLIPSAERVPSPAPARGGLDAVHRPFQRQTQDRPSATISTAGDHMTTAIREPFRQHDHRHADAVAATYSCVSRRRSRSRAAAGTRCRQTPPRSSADGRHGGGCR